LIAVVRSFNEPPKNSSSVRIEIALAPYSAYAVVTSATVDELFIMPLEGDLLLNSAMIPVLSSLSKNCLKLRTRFLK
jgi:hypothetical protein